MSRKSKRGFQKLGNHELTEFTSLQQDSGSEVELDLRDPEPESAGRGCCWCLVLLLVLLMCMAILVGTYSGFMSYKVYQMALEMDDKYKQVDQEIKDLKSEIDDVKASFNRRFIALGSTIMEVNDSVAMVMDKVQGSDSQVSKQLNQLRENVSELDQRLQVMERTPQEVLIHQVEAIHREMGILNHSMGLLNHSLSDVQEMRGRMASMASEFERYDSQLSDLRKDFGDLSHSLNSDVNELKSDVSGVKAQVKNYQQTHEQTQQSLDLLSEGEALIDDLKRKRQEKEDLMRDKMADLQKKRNRCLEQRRTKPSVPLVGGSEEKEDSCQQYRDAQSAAKQAASEQGEVEAELDNTEFLTATSDKSRQTLERQIGGIDARIRQLQTRLEGAAAPSTEVAEDSEESIGMKETDMDTSWMEFEFDTSRTEEVRSEQEKRMSYDFEVEASGHYATQGWSSAASSSFDMNAQSFAQEMSTAECRVKAKVLKVTIKRPWFKTSLFRSRHFSTRDGGTISPGPMPEDELIFELSKRSYGLPEYATAFLLAKDVEMDFRGVSSKTVSSALSMSASGKFEGGYGPFSATTRTAAAGASSNVATQATTDGLKIRIPGAQIIGYYLHVVPRFPIKAVGDEY